MSVRIHLRGAFPPVCQGLGAARGEGYSSKAAVLAPLAEKYFGKEIGAAFKDLFKLYVKSECGMHFLSDEEARSAIDHAKKVLEVYDLQPATC